LDPTSTQRPSPAFASRALRSTARAFVMFLRVLRANPLTLVGFILVVVIVGAAGLMAVVPHVLAPYGPLQASNDFVQGPSVHHLLGTDGNGYDIYSEVMYALPLDLLLAVAIAGFALIFGGALGLISGYWDTPGTLAGALSTLILRITDVFLAFPSLILALAITVGLGLGAWQAALAVMLTWWPYYVRLVRGETLAVKHLPYVTAAKAAGVTDGRIVLRHILRNVLEPVVVYFSMDIGTVLVTFSTIGFVVVPIPYPSATPEWGSMMSYYQNSGLITSYPWTILGPGAAIFITVLAFSLLGDGLRDILDPRSRRVLAGTGTGGISAGAPDPLRSASAPPAESTPVPEVRSPS